MDAFSVRTKIMIGGGMDALAQRLHRVFLVTDKFMAESGKTNYVTDRLLRNGGEFKIFSDVQADPDIATVTRGVEQILEFQPDAVVAFGGGSAIDAAADIGIAPQPGPEVVTGSTRLKSGTAQKMVLNMLSTAVMVKLGKVYSNLMVDVCASNQKLVARAVSIVCCATGVSPERARGVLDEAGFSAKTAIVMILCGVDAGEAHALLQRVDGQVSAAVLSRPDGVQTDAFVRRL
mgnify:CR=1 FL=1